MHYWGQKSGRTSAGHSGVRPDMVKAASPLVHEHMLALYNPILTLKAIPDQWRRSTVVPIPKKPGAVGLGDLRPLKLLEITRKAILSIVKSRLRAVLDSEDVLHPAQHGFRSDHMTATAAMLLLNQIEEARFLRKDLHILCIDIRKAYDTVIRAIGTEGALRRLGVPLPVVELLMEVERRSLNDVRTAGDPLLDPLDFLFEAERGFVQGSAISPLLWTIFYDMVLCELSKRGVGDSVGSDTGLGFGGGGGLVAFADDTMLAAASLTRLQRDVTELSEVFQAVCLDTASNKSVHIPLIFKRDEGGVEERWLFQELVEQGGPRLKLNGLDVPFVEADEGFRFLGYTLDLTGDYGDQQDKLCATIDDFGSRISRARISKGALLYIVEAVLIPRVMYPMAVIPFTPNHIRYLESRALRWILPKLGLTRTFSRDLLGMELDWGGLGWDRWTTRVAVLRSDLARRMATHKSWHVRGVWWSLRHRLLLLDTQTELRYDLGCTSLGEPHTHPLETAAAASTWMDALSASLALTGVNWDRGWRPLAAAGGHTHTPGGCRGGEGATPHG